MFKRVGRGHQPRWVCDRCGGVFIFLPGWAIQAGKDPLPPPNYCPVCGKHDEGRTEPLSVPEWLRGRAGNASCNT
jgi:hypothetical protein